MSPKKLPQVSKMSISSDEDVKSYLSHESNLSTHSKNAKTKFVDYGKQALSALERNSSLTKTPKPEYKKYLSLPLEDLEKLKNKQNAKL